MATPDEGSVAPAERVNIVYRPAMDGAKEDVELPLKMLVTGDFTGIPDSTPIEQREAINVDKDNFNEVLKAQNVGLNFKVANTLSEEPGHELDVNLSFKAMNDFSPEKVAAQVPEIQALLEIREALTALKGPLANVPEFRTKLQNIIKDETTRKQFLNELGMGDAEGKP